MHSSGGDASEGGIAPQNAFPCVLALHVQPLSLLRDGSLRAAVPVLWFSPICPWLLWDCSRMRDPGMGKGKCPPGISSRNCLLLPSHLPELPRAASGLHPRACNLLFSPLKFKLVIPEHLQAADDSQLLAAHRAALAGA